MPGEEKPVTASELMKCLEGFKTSMTDELKKSMKETVHSEINDAVGHISERQNEIIEDLSATKQLVSEMQIDHSNMKETVAELRQQLDEMKSLSKEHPTPPTASSDSLPPLLPSVSLQSFPSSSEAQRDPAYTSALKVLQSAKRILGFSPIKSEDLAYLKERNSIDDENEVKRMSIVEFLTCEMKIPHHIADTIVITRVFPPAKQPSGWTTLYAEFSDASVPDLINQYATNLLPGRSVSIYVPHSLWPRFQVINTIAHSYRNGPIKYKTKIKYGLSDFVLLVKPKDQNTASWTYPPLDLPPLRLSAFDGNLSSSPPPGRTRLPSKRARSPSPGSDSTNRVNKAKQNDLERPDSVPDDETENAGAIQKTLNLQHDTGAFHPSACASPKASFNKNFTFGASQIPRMNSLNC